MEMNWYTFTPSKSVWPVTVTSHFCLHCHGCGLPWWSRKGTKRWPQLTYLSIRKEEWRQIKPKEKKTTWKKSKRSNPQQQYLVCVRSHVRSNWGNLTFNRHACIFISVCSPTQEWNGDSTHSYSHSTAHPILTRVLTERPYYRVRRSELPGEGSRKSYIQTPCRYSLRRLRIKLTPHIWALS